MVHVIFSMFCAKINQLFYYNKNIIIYKAYEIVFGKTEKCDRLFYLFFASSLSIIIVTEFILFQFSHTHTHTHTYIYIYGMFQMSGIFK